MDDQEPNLPAITTLIIASYLSKNQVPQSELGRLIKAVHAALDGLNDSGPPPVSTLVNRQPPAVPIKKSITPDYLISLENGRTFQSLRRHLTTLGMTPESYRAKWGLPADYPMVSGKYRARRSAIARQIGLGKGVRKEAPKAPEE